MDKTIRRVVDVAEQDAENYRNCQGLTIGERLVAISEMRGGVPGGGSRPWA